MKTKQSKPETFMNKRLMSILLAVAILLLIPLVAQFEWGPLDFVIMGILLLVTGLSCEFVLRKVKKTEYRVAICIAILGIFFLVWAELAVGIFGTPFAGS